MLRSFCDVGESGVLATAICVLDEDNVLVTVAGCFRGRPFRAVKGNGLRLLTNTFRTPTQCLMKVDAVQVS